MSSSRLWGEELQKARRAAGLTQTDLSRLSGVPQARISQLERHNPPIRVCRMSQGQERLLKEGLERAGLGMVPSKYPQRGGGGVVYRVLSLRVEDSMHQEIEMLASISNISISEWTRRALREAMDRQENEDIPLQTQDGG